MNDRDRLRLAFERRLGSAHPEFTDAEWREINRLSTADQGEAYAALGSLVAALPPGEWRPPHRSDWDDTSQVRRVAEDTHGFEVVHYWEKRGPEVLRFASAAEAARAVLSLGVDPRADGVQVYVKIDRTSAGIWVETHRVGLRIQCASHPHLSMKGYCGDCGRNGCAECILDWGPFGRSVCENCRR